MTRKQTTKKTASDLISGAEAPRFALTDEQVKQVELVLGHNDRSRLSKRVNIHRVHELLRAEYGLECCVTIFERLVCERFARKSWGSR